MKAFEHAFAVRGVGNFPIDMLRYERAFPASEADSNAIVSPATEPRVVWLRRRSITKAYFPENSRWKSFGWDVMESSLTSTPI